MAPLVVLNRGILSVCSKIEKIFIKLIIVRFSNHYLCLPKNSSVCKVFPYRSVHCVSVITSVMPVERKKAQQINLSEMLSLGKRSIACRGIS